MTIALAINTNEGAVLATDSAGSITNGNQVLQVYNNSIKIVNLYKGRPFGVATYGLGNIGPYSITLLAKEFRETISGTSQVVANPKLLNTRKTVQSKPFNPNSYKLSDVARDFARFMQTFYSKEFTSKRGVFPTLGFILTGYSSGERLPETYVIESDVKGKMKVAPQNILGGSGIVAKGQPDAINSLTLGVSFEVLDAVIAGLQLPPQAATQFVRLCFSKIHPVVHRTMPIQDTIDLARFLVETGIQFQRFKFDDKTVGGPVEIATMTRYEGFKWVQRKHYYDAALNPLHV